MFFKFAAWNAGVAPSTTPSLTSIEQLIRIHPAVLIAALEQYYSTRTPIPGVPDYNHPNPPQILAAPGPLQNAIGLDPGQRWDHVIYAYMIENTRIFEIFDRVLREYEAGERFETPEPDAALWLRSTEALFYSPMQAGYIGALTSQLRPDLRATRRNTYYRLLGLDLNHGVEGNRAYPFEKPTAANRDFVGTFEMMLREIWRGSMNANNAVGPNEADAAAIADHAQRIRDMMNVRRNNGNLRREEFWAVVAMSWFHLALAEDTPIVRALKAEAENPADRLRKIGERVGIAAHSRANAYFNMAWELSQVLTFIETDPNATQAASASGYYMPGGPWPAIAADMRTIITQWTMATGREMKALPVALSAPPGRPNARAPLPGRTDPRMAAIAAPR